MDERDIDVLDNQIVEILKEKTPQQRLMIAFGVWESVKNQMTGYLKAAHPDWSEVTVKKAVARRLSHGAV